MNNIQMKLIWLTFISSLLSSSLADPYRRAHPFPLLQYTFIFESIRLSRALILRLAVIIDYVLNKTLVDIVNKKRQRERDAKERERKR